MFTKSRGWIGSVTALVMAVSIAAVPSAMAENTPNDSSIRAELTKSLSNAKFKDIQTSVQNGTVSLTGTVNVYGDKLEAEKKAHKPKAVAAVRDDIKVAGPAVPDEVLQAKLLSQIQSDRIGYGTTTFNAISVNVQNGVVALGGTAYGPVDKEYALIDASYMAGVKDVIDNIQGRSSFHDGRQDSCRYGAGSLRVSVAQQIRDRSRQAHPHRSAERKRNAGGRGDEPG